MTVAPRRLLTVFAKSRDMPDKGCDKPFKCQLFLWFAEASRPTFSAIGNHEAGAVIKTITKQLFYEYLVSTAIGCAIELLEGGKVRGLASNGRA